MTCGLSSKLWRVVSIYVSILLCLCACVCVCVTVACKCVYYIYTSICTVTGLEIICWSVSSLPFAASRQQQQQPTESLRNLKLPRGFSFNYEQSVVVVAGWLCLFAVAFFVPFCMSIKRRSSRDLMILLCFVFTAWPQNSHLSSSPSLLLPSLTCPSIWATQSSTPSHHSLSLFAL